MLTPEQMLLIVAGAQLPLLALSIVVVFSLRKARPQSGRQPEFTALTPPIPEFLRQTPPLESAAPQPQIQTPPPAPSTQAEAPPELAPAPELSIEITRQASPAAESGEPAGSIPPTPPILLEPAPEEILQTPPVIATPPPVAPPTAIETAPAAPAPARFGLGLRRTRDNFLARIRAALTGSDRLDEIYERLEEALIAADVGVETSLKIVETVRARLKNDARADVIREALKDAIAAILKSVERPVQTPEGVPLVIMLAGVNGVGKTTTIAKLAARFKAERGAPVVVAASDTFRAAAIEQLEIWCDRVGAELIKQKQGSDPAAVAFDAVKAAVARNASTVLIDTAGRLQTKVNLMEELKKIRRVIAREMPSAPHETWLVLDATTGQNALSQAKLFGETAQLTGVILAKLDSTAKGGVIIAIAENLRLPVQFVGLGENIADLQPFEGDEFVNALFSDAPSGSEAVNRTYAA